MKNIPFLLDEKWAELLLVTTKNSPNKYAVSNHGRVISYKSNIETGRLLLKNNKKGSVPVLKVCDITKTYRFAIHKLVAKYFLLPPKDDCKYVLHIDRNSANNHYKNLVYANYADYRNHLLKKSNNNNGKIRLFVNELYMQVDVSLTERKYAITNFGRLISYENAVEDGIFINGTLHKDGYKIWRYKVAGKNNHQLFHRIVANYFLEKPNFDEVFVIHLDHNKTNNTVANLKWVNQKALNAHTSLNPVVQKYQAIFSNMSKINGRGKKLTVGKVLLLKKILQSAENTTRKKMLARQFGISSMQLYRIETGENWGWATV